MYLQFSHRYQINFLPHNKDNRCKPSNLQRSFLISLLCYYKYVKINIILQTKLHRENDNRWSNFYSKDIT